MGCIQAQSAQKIKEKKNNLMRTITHGRGRSQQGVNELKMNYFLDGKVKVLGTGAFGKVFMTTNKLDTNFKVAIKVLDKKKLQSKIEQIVEEVAILNTLDHPNIVKYFETYDDKKYVYLVMEYISGCQLFDKIVQQ